MRRLAIVFLALLTILMGVVGWILGRPGVFRPEAQALAAPAGESSAPHPATGGFGGGSPSLNAHSGHADAHGE